MHYSSRLIRKFGRYDKKYLKSVRFFDACYAFDISAGGRLVCVRENDGGTTKIESVFDLMSSEECQFAFEYVKSYTSVPAVVSTFFGEALLLPQFTPSSSLFVVVIPKAKSRDRILAGFNATVLR